MPLDESDSDRVSRYLLTVVASSLRDVVDAAGGWLCDRARAGWDVNVVVADPHDARPLTILGATPVPGEPRDALGAVSKGGAVAISAAVLADEGIRRQVHGLVKRGVTDITVWGGHWPEFGLEGDRLEHRLSSAARAFKAVALGGGTVAPTETLLSLAADSLRPLYAV